ncbi:HAD-IB family phosphatase [Streptomyces subrutilus]|uniref:HAD family hydrolase n=1 Tax=Streptomyces subrutilus TaxID=36818 RepID=A0A1E5Q0G1_9ACTN|nr:HAD-IB family phosphatase [Streptomyces subrutilus]OEJ35233.1 hypothetical protein BGK67_31515 [Streptomyces subrutilus]
MPPPVPGPQQPTNTSPIQDTTHLPPVRAVVCDLDHTLTPHSSVIELSRALAAPIGEVTTLYCNYQNGQLTHEQTRTQLLTLWTRAGLATRTTIETVFHQLPLKDDALRFAAALAARGLPLCLITSSAQLYADIMTLRLGATCGYGNGQVFFNTAGGLEDIDFTPDTADLKLRQLAEFTTEHGLEPTEVIAVGNGSNDLLLFDATHRGVLVETTTSTRHSAHAWATVRDLDPSRPGGPPTNLPRPERRNWPTAPGLTTRPLTTGLSCRDSCQTSSGLFFTASPNCRTGSTRRRTTATRAREPGAGLSRLGASVSGARQCARNAHGSAGHQLVVLC